MQKPLARFLVRARYGLAEHGPAPLLAFLFLLADGAFGVALHFGAVAFRVHGTFSVLAAAVAVWAGVISILHNLDSPPVRRAALLLISLTFSQILLGVGSYMNLLAAGTLQWFPIAHAVMAVAALGASIALAAAVYGRIRPEDAELARGGVAIA